MSTSTKRYFPYWRGSLLVLAILLALAAMDRLEGDSLAHLEPPSTLESRRESPEAVDPIRHIETTPYAPDREREKPYSRAEAQPLQLRLEYPDPKQYGYVAWRTSKRGRAVVWRGLVPKRKSLPAYRGRTIGELAGGASLVETVGEFSRRPRPASAAAMVLALGVLGGGGVDAGQLYVITAARRWAADDDIETALLRGQVAGEATTLRIRSDVPVASVNVTLASVESCFTEDKRPAVVPWPQTTVMWPPASAGEAPCLPPLTFYTPCRNNDIQIQGIPEGFGIRDTIQALEQTYTIASRLHPNLDFPFRSRHWARLIGGEPLIDYSPVSQVVFPNILATAAGPLDLADGHDWRIRCIALQGDGRHRRVADAVYDTSAGDWTWRPTYSPRQYEGAPVRFLLHGRGLEPWECQRELHPDPPLQVRLEQAGDLWRVELLVGVEDCASLPVPITYHARVKKHHRALAGTAWCKDGGVLTFEGLQGPQESQEAAYVKVGARIDTVKVRDAIAQALRRKRGSDRVPVFGIREDLKRRRVSHEVDWQSRLIRARYQGRLLVCREDEQGLREFLRDMAIIDEYVRVAEGE